MRFVSIVHNINNIFSVVECTCSSLTRSSKKTMTSKMAKNLAVFDFDHTIIHGNSDVEVMNMINHKNIPQELKQLHRSDGWTAFMQGIFELLFEHEIKEQNIKQLVESLPEVPGMSKLIQELNKNLNYDVIIISDSNSYFINTWLEANNLQHCVTKVFTNAAKFVEDILKIKMYHLQTHCKLSTKNLCKGQIMEDFIKEQGEKGLTYTKIMYCGDGINDFCPILRLQKKDLACVRDKYKCVEVVKKARGTGYTDEEGVLRVVKCAVCTWNDGSEILNFIKQEWT